MRELVCRPRKECIQRTWLRPRFCACAVTQGGDSVVRGRQPSVKVVLFRAIPFHSHFRRLAKFFELLAMNSPVAPWSRFRASFPSRSSSLQVPDHPPQNQYSSIKKTHHAQLVSLVKTALARMRSLAARYTAVNPCSVPFELLLCPSNDALLPLVCARALLVRRGRGRKRRAVRVVGGVESGICLTRGGWGVHLLRRGAMAEEGEGRGWREQGGRPCLVPAHALICMRSLRQLTPRPRPSLPSAQPGRDALGEISAADGCRARGEVRRESLDGSRHSARRGDPER